MTIGDIGAARAGGGAPAQAAATFAPMSMEVVQPDEGCRMVSRMVDGTEAKPVFGAPLPAARPANGGSELGATAPAQMRSKFKRPAAPPQPGAAQDPTVLYTSRPGGTPFGMAGAPGEQWACSK